MRRRCWPRLKAAGLRAELDLRNEKINYKVREHSLAKVPVMLVVGKREAGRATPSRCAASASSEQEVLALDDAVNRLKDEAALPA